MLKIEEETQIKAELYRLKQNLIEDSKFLKRVFDKESNAFHIIPNVEYQYQMKEVIKKKPKHWTFEEKEEKIRPGDFIKQSSQYKNETIQSPNKSYTYRDTELKNLNSSTRNINENSSRSINNFTRNLSILSRETPKNRSSKLSFDFKTAEKNANRLSTRNANKSIIANSPRMDKIFIMDSPSENDTIIKYPYVIVERKIISKIVNYLQ